MFLIYYLLYCVSWNLSNVKSSKCTFYWQDDKIEIGQMDKFTVDKWGYNGIFVNISVTVIQTFA